MKAGKSTFLNALIGADILASESEACTVCRTDIRPINKGSKPRLLEYREGKRKPIMIAEGEAEAIRHRFLERTHEIRATQNDNKIMRFELEHPIEAIGKLPSLAGFTLVDTPGPNEWESAEFSTVELKKTALEALRTCDAILFILDYTSFKDNTNSELLEELIERRKETLQANTGKLYFILNKVDRIAQKDRPIEDVIKDLKQALMGFGILDPIVYPASAWQGLLAKLIQQEKATNSQEEDFIQKFAAKYTEKDEKGRRYIPEPYEIAPQALQDSGIPTIEDSVIQTVVQNSGWNLLSDVLSILDKSAKAIEDTLNTRISGWEMELEELKQKVEIFQQYSALAEKKVNQVKTSIKHQKQILIKGFSEGIKEFAEIAKTNIKEEIDKLVEARQTQPEKRVNSLFSRRASKKEINGWDFFSNLVGSLGNVVLEMIPNSPLKQVIFKISCSLLDTLTGTEEDWKGEPSNNNQAEEPELDPYTIKYRDQQKAKKLIDNINNFCTPHIQSWWVNTEDELITYGTAVRKVLTQQIQTDIQGISDELSRLIGETLKVELNTNPIQFPVFDFLGIDNLMKTQQEAIIRVKAEKRGGGFCQSEYYVNVPYQDGTEDVYVIDLREITNAINKKIDSQVRESNKFLERIIEKQIEDDFQNAEQQINNYINRFQDIFNNLIQDRETKEGEKEKICSVLENQKAKLTNYLAELSSLRLFLNDWKP
ncbi:hypothetical protein CFPU101_45520 [Chroococcus sp. FPU101]|nr:hypothetical protein CFPU101_45520 [Chroococcus sp. FPU101]